MERGKVHIQQTKLLRLVQTHLEHTQHKQTGPDNHLKHNSEKRGVCRSLVVSASVKASDNNRTAKTRVHTVSPFDVFFNLSLNRGESERLGGDV